MQPGLEITTALAPRSTNVPVDIMRLVAGDLISGTVSKVDIQGHAVLRTALGQITLASTVPLPRGSTVSLEVTNTDGRFTAVIREIDGRPPTLEAPRQNLPLPPSAPPRTAPAVIGSGNADPLLAVQPATPLKVGDVVKTIFFASPPTVAGVPTAPATAAPGGEATAITPRLNAATNGARLTFTIIALAAPKQPFSGQTPPGQVSGIQPVSGPAGLGQTSSAQTPLVQTRSGSPHPVGDPRPINTIGGHTPPATGPAPFKDDAASPVRVIPAPAWAAPAKATASPRAEPTGVVPAPSIPRSPVSVSPRTPISPAAGVTFSNAQPPRSNPKPGFEPTAETITRPPTGSSDSRAAARSGANGTPGNAVPPATAEAKTLGAVVVGTDSDGRTLLRVPAGILRTEAPLPSLPAGTTLTLQVTEADDGTLPQAPFGNVRVSPERVLFERARDWPTLRKVVETLRETAPERAPEIIDRALPSIGPRLTASMMFFLSALRGGSVRGWLGNEAAAILEKAGAGDLLSRLENEFGQMNRVNAQQPSGDNAWRILIAPLFDGHDIRPLTIFSRRQQRGGGDDGGTWFVVAVELTRLGPLQLDGFVHERRFDLVLRSHTSLSAAFRREVSDIFTEGTALGDFKGSLRFQVTKVFPVSPWEDVIGDGNHGLSSERGLLIHGGSASIAEKGTGNEVARPNRSTHLERRDLLMTGENPDSRRDYLVTREAALRLAPLATSARLIVRYVPDRLILPSHSLPVYLARLESMDWPNLEALGSTLLSDLSNELVPRWIRVELFTDGNDGSRHHIALGDRQPGWRNPDLLDRLPPL